MTQEGYRGAPSTPGTVLVTTGNAVSGYRIAAYLGVVVRSASIGQGFVGAFKSLGEATSRMWAQVCDAARQDAYLRMLAHAEALGANAIIAMRCDALRRDATRPSSCKAPPRSSPTRRPSASSAEARPRRLTAAFRREIRRP